MSVLARIRESIRETKHGYYSDVIPHEILEMTGGGNSYDRLELIEVSNELSMLDRPLLIQVSALCDAEAIHSALKDVDFRFLVLESIDESSSIGEQAVTSSILELALVAGASTPVDLGDFFRFNEWDELRCLVIDECVVSSDTWAALAMSEDICPEELRFIQCGMSVRHVLMMLKSDISSRVKSLHLEGVVRSQCGPSREMYIRQEALKLRALTLEDCYLDQDMIHVLSTGVDSSDLEVLVLNGIRCESSAAEVLMRLARGALFDGPLRRLSLNRNGLSLNDIVSLINAIRCSSLNELHIMGNDIESSKATEVQRYLPRCRVVVG